MRIQHNIMAMNAYRNYTNNVSAMKKNLEKLSSGYKINRAGDDAAGLAISEKMRAQITGLQTAQKNAKDGISLIQTAEGALTEVHDMLNRMVTLATQSANGTYDNETDRFQLQKEVDQLRDEINRIADSSNFNGLKLLDGTLGMNTDAFTVSTAGAVDADNGALNIANYVPASTVSSPDLHLEELGTSAVTAKFTLDFSGYEVKNSGYTSAASGVLTVNFAGTSIAVTLTAYDSSLKATVTGGDIAADFITSISNNVNNNVNATTSGSNRTSLRIGNFVYKATQNDSCVEFELIGQTADPSDASKFKDLSALPITSGDANTINTAIGSPVTLSYAAPASGGTSTESVKQDVHYIREVVQAKAEEKAKKAGIDLTLSTDFIKQGGMLTIDGKSFIFQTEDTAPANPTTATVINLSGVSAANLLHEAVDKLSQQAEFTGADDRKWKLSSGGNGKIHIDQTESTATGKPALSTYDDLVSKISVSKGMTDAKEAGNKVTFSSTPLEGNVLTIAGQKFEFSDKKTGTAADGAIYVGISGSIANAVQNLANAVSAAGISGVSVESDATSVTVRAAAATDDIPSILGKGLTLQIGDTAESFNQLNVLVNDTHCSSLGIHNISIADQDSAATAVDAIKAAINYVSDVRGSLGATQNRLDHTINNLSVMTENIQDAESTIRDTDVAEEMMAYTKNNILIQSAQAMLAQANQVPQGVLQLLQ